jgi:hypothetical protein
VRPAEVDRRFPLASDPTRIVRRRRWHRFESCRGHTLKGPDLLGNDRLAGVAAPLDVDLTRKIPATLGSRSGTVRHSVAPADRDDTSPTRNVTRGISVHAWSRPLSERRSPLAAPRLTCFSPVGGGAGLATVKSGCGTAASSLAERYAVLCDRNERGVAAAPQPSFVATI